MSKRTVFSHELDKLKAWQDFISQEDLSSEVLRAEFMNLIIDHKEVLDQAKLITKVSDKLQNKLNNANESLAHKNIELQTTIDELTKARAGRKATTIVFAIAIVFFIVADGILDPMISTWSHGSFWVSMGVKGLLTLALKPVESFVEKALISLAYKNEKAKTEPAK